MVRLWPTAYLGGGTKGLNLNMFFRYNKKTPEKVEYAEKLIKKHNINTAFAYTSVRLDPNWSGEEKENDEYNGIYISSIDRLQNQTVDGLPILKTNERVIQRVTE